MFSFSPINRLAYDGAPCFCDGHAVLATSIRLLGFLTPPWLASTMLHDRFFAILRYPHLLWTVLF